MLMGSEALLIPITTIYIHSFAKQRSTNTLTLKGHKLALKSSGLPEELK